MAKKRNTAKTGDQALYKNRNNPTNTKKKNEDDDAMFDVVDRYHNEKEQDFLKLDTQDSESEDDGITKTENVLDLGLADSSDDDDSSQDDNVELSEDDEEQAPTSESDNDDDDDEQDQQQDVRDWGKRKSAYYHGDTADLEIGQEQEDAYLEEEAAKEVQAARYEQMQEEDFVLSDDDDDAAIKDDEATFSAKRDVTKLSKSDKKKWLQSHHPEILPMVTHFSKVLREYETSTRVVAKVLLEDDEGAAEAVGATSAGLQYLVTKSMLQSSTALNVAMYLLLKTEQTKDEFLGEDEGPSIQSHPVMARLQQWNTMAQKLEDRVESKVEALSDQITNLIKASTLMKPKSDNEDDKDSDSKDDIEEVEGTPMVDDEDDDENDDDDDDDSVSLEESDEDDAQIAKSVLNEARFGLRQKEIVATGSTRIRRAAPTDFGDEEIDDARSSKALQGLAKTVNSLEQKSATRLRKSNKAPIESLDDSNMDDESRLQAGFDMMDAELGPEDDEDGGGEVDDETDDSDNDGMDFYEQVKTKSKERKAFKKSLHEVAPKFPRIDLEVQGERAIGNQILKNRGLVPHKAKINRNPRVKKREQYRKALIRRKGTVREVRTDEGHKYGGEETGIKSGLSRSRKLGVK